jgi:hypothetical protein
MTIDESNEGFEKTEAETPESREPDSNVTAQRDRHSGKHDVPLVSTEAGMQIDQRDRHFENMESSIRER